MYFITVLTVHTVLCVTLIGLVLLQQGKGADAGATFGGGASNSVFGAAGATDFITRLTTSLAIGFMVTSILLIRAYNSDGGVLLSTKPTGPITEGSIIERVLQPEEVAVEEVPVEEGAEEAAAEEVTEEASAEEPAAAAVTEEESAEEAVEEKAETAEAVADEPAAEEESKSDS